MLTRRSWCSVALLALASLPSAAFARARRPASQPTPAGAIPASTLPLHWELVVDRATYDVAELEPPTLPAAPGRIEIQYAWQENDKIEQWWQQVIEGSNDPKNIILYAKRGPDKKAVTLMSYALDGVRLTSFKGPQLSRTGGYNGPSTAVVTYQAVRVLPK